MARTVVIVPLLLALTLARAGSHPPRDVVDYYLLLPSGYFEGLAADTRSERLRLFRDMKGSYIDRRHGFLHIAGDGAQPDVNVCLFKRPEATYLIAVNSNTGSDGWDPFKVTREVRPPGINRLLGFVLPRYGTTIKVVTERGRTVDYLYWDGSGFRVRPAGRH